MKISLSVKLPSSARQAFVGRMSGSFGRAMQVAKQRIVPLVVDRASQVAEKKVPDFAKHYKTALQAPGAVDVTDKEVVIDIKDPLVIARERGSKAFDMKPKLLAKGKAAKGGGVYVDVPFQHKAGGVPQRIRTAAYRAAKEINARSVQVLARTKGKSFTRTLQRGRIGQALGLAPKKQQVQHKRGVHDDIIRSSSRPRKRGGAASVRYTTMRRISSKSAPSSWWNPGFKAARALDNVLVSLRREIGNIIRDAFATVRSDGK